MTSTRRVGRLAAAALALAGAATFAACGDEGAGSGSGSDSGAGFGFGDRTDRAGRFAAELEGMPGVVSAEVEENVIEGEGVENLYVDVVVEADAAPADVTAVLDAVDRHDDELGFQQDHSTLVQREGRESGTLGYGHEDLETTAELVRRWTVAADGLDPSLTWTADGYGEVRVELGETAGVDDVTELAATIAADADLATLPRWTLVAEGGDARAYLSTEAGVTEAVLGSWRDAVANLALSPDPGGTSISLAPQNSPGSYTSDPPPAGSMRLDVELSLPDVHSAAQLTPARHGDLLWPLLRAELDVLRGLPPGSQFAADHYYEEADGTGGGLDQFLYVTIGERPGREEPDRGWNRAAARYLAAG